MFTAKETNLFNDSYFYVVRKNDSYYEILSKPTNHCWIIQKLECSGKYPLIIHHKHCLNDRYYHRHGNALTVAIAIKSIKAHDDYVLQKQLPAITICK